ncbi:Leucine-rich repeat [Seminavis robusta]|uniref:Leucine-rich repeat n=1 Tax=Seminavis robusta TaxID=568900 RepID=A0A9N8DHL5_9STRA|nr:Leucine-rich repeat [Seminavis robusta]|eukprot:Sro94_g049060.1 Leucine-rich repeat (976) ;mRNA; r:84704-87897
MSKDEELPTAIEDEETELDTSAKGAKKKKKKKKRQDTAEHDDPEESHHDHGEPDLVEEELTSKKKKKKKKRLDESEAEIEAEDDGDAADEEAISKKKKKKKTKLVDDEMEADVPEDDESTIRKKKKKKKQQQSDGMDEEVEGETALVDEEEVASKKKKKQKHQRLDENIDMGGEAALMVEEATRKKKKKKKKEQLLEEQELEEQQQLPDPADDDDDIASTKKKKTEAPADDEDESTISKNKKTKKKHSDVEANDEAMDASSSSKKKKKKKVAAMDEQSEVATSPETETPTEPPAVASSSKPGAYAESSEADSTGKKGKRRATSSAIPGAHAEQGRPPRPSKMTVVAAAGISSTIKASHRDLDNSANLVQRERAAADPLEELPGARPGLADRAKSKQLGAKSSRSMGDGSRAKSKRFSKDAPTAATTSTTSSSSSGVNRKQSSTRLSLRTLETAKLEEDSRIRATDAKSKTRQNSRRATKLGAGGGKSSAKLSSRCGRDGKAAAADVDLEAGLRHANVGPPGASRSNYDTVDTSSRDQNQPERGEEHLVQAILVEEDSEPFIAAAIQVDKTKEDSSSKPIYEHKHFSVIVGAICCLLLIIVIVIAVAVATSLGGGSNNAGGATGSAVLFTPTLAPTGISPDFDLTRKYFESSGIVDEENWNRLYNETSPYYKALHWIVYTDQRKPGAQRIEQRYLLALLYYSTSQDGPWLACNPPQLVNTDSTCIHKKYRLQGGGNGGGGGGGGNSNGPDSGDSPDGPGGGGPRGGLPRPGGRLLQGSYDDEASVRWLSQLDECFWAGIQCAGPAKNEVAELNLEHYQLSGTLPPEIGKIPLRHIDIRGNRIRGGIPSSIRKWTKMRKMWLKENKLEGTLPNGICNLITLDELEVSENRLQGQLPTCINQLTRLQQLALNENRFSGQIPELEALNNLDKAEFDGNQFTGSIPQSFCNLELQRLTADTCANDNPRVQCDCCTHGNRC